MKSRKVLTHSCSCFVAGTPISSNVFGPLLGTGFAAGDRAGLAGLGSGAGAATEGAAGAADEGMRMSCRGGTFEEAERKSGLEGFFSP